MFFEIGTLANLTVSKTKNTLGSQLFVLMKTLFNNAPGVGLKVFVHNIMLFVSCSE
jgi:hypothetical protein